MGLIFVFPIVCRHEAEQIRFEVVFQLLTAVGVNFKSFITSLFLGSLNQII
jgi:hypothetical protein